MTEIWNIKDSWDGEWNIWKQYKFNELNMDEIDDVAGDFLEKLRVLDKDVKVWGVFNVLKDKIETLRNLTPLINALKDEAMRERHWKELRFEVKEDFDENSEDFTLEKINGLNLLNHQDKIYELSDNARKELKIEIMLKEIKRMWETDSAAELDVVKMKSKANNEEYFKI